MPTRLGRLIYALFFISLPGRLPCLAQNAPAPDTSAPTLKVYSREIVVDTTVTDNKGNPVHGLTRDQFTVKEDRRPQPIHSFYEYAATPQPTPSKLPPNTYTNLQPAPASGAIDIVWLDFTNIAPVVPPDIANDPSLTGTMAGALAAERNAKLAAMKYVAGMPPGTRIGVVGSSFPSTLRTLQGVTSNPALLSAAIDAMAYDTSGTAINPETWCDQQERRNRMTLETLQQIAADLSEIKGRKNLLWFTLRTWLLTSQLRPKCLFDHTAELQKAYALLAAAQVTVFPISVRGVEAPSPEEANDIMSMESIADATGGAAYYNSNDFADLMGKAISKGSDYYSLSYVPPGARYDYSHHTIDVSVSRPALTLVYRKTYDAIDPATIKPATGLTLTTTPPAISDGDMRPAMTRNMPTSTGILFDVQVVPVVSSPNPTVPAGTILGTLDPAAKEKLKGKPLTRYGFSYSIPAAQLTFTPASGDAHKGVVDLDLAVFDADGKLVTGLSQTVTMPLTDARYQQFIQGPFRFAQQIDLPPGKLFLRIGVLDRTSNKVGTLEIPLTVPKQ
jgi:VWFA-related protein